MKSGLMVDVAIVGAGPAGTWCAHQLARSGAAVTLLDGTHPREKPCGGGVTARALALVNEHAAAPASKITHARFAYAGRTASVDLLKHHRGSRLDVWSRREFDGRLLARALNAGATFVAERVTQIRRQNGGWSLDTRTGTVSARWIVGADGANSLVRRHVGRSFDRADLSIGCGYFVHGVSSNAIDIEFVAQPPGYLWSFPRPDHLAIGIGAQADESSTPVLMRVVDEWMQRNGHSRGERYSWPIPSLTAPTLERERFAGDGWMLVGDAAGLVDPITREGIFFALQSGDFAASSLIEGADCPSAYRDRLHAHITPELLRAARLKARFFRPAFSTLLIHALQRSERIAEVMADLVAGEQPYESLRSRLLQTWELSLLWDLVRLQRT